MPPVANTRMPASAAAIIVAETVVPAQPPSTSARLSVDRDALRHCFVAGLDDPSALVVHSIARDVDHPPQGLGVALSEKPNSEVDCTGDGGAGSATDRGLGQLRSELHGVLRSLDHRPGHDDVLNERTGPFGIDDGDSRQGTLPNGVVDFRRLKGQDESLPLDPLFLGVHRPRDVDREHEGKVDLGLGKPRRRSRKQRTERQDGRSDETHDALHKVSPRFSAHSGARHSNRKERPLECGRADGRPNASPLYGKQSAYAGRRREMTDGATIRLKKLRSAATLHRCRTRRTEAAMWKQMLRFVDRRWVLKGAAVIGGSALTPALATTTPPQGKITP